jgi:DNA-binding NtrC family response regulator
MDGKPGEVLIVDADAPIRGLLATVVRRLPRKPVMASDGARALELLASRDFDAVIMDLFSSGAAGSEILAHIHREKPSLLERVIVITTATKLGTDGELGTVAAVIRKPFAIDELQSALKHCCERKAGDQ